MVENQAKRMGAIPDGYQEIVVDWFKFEVPGDYIEGMLVGKTQVTVRSSRIGKYTLMRDDKTKVGFLGGAQLDDLMVSVQYGQSVFVQFVGEERTKDEFGLKIYKVFVKPK